MAYVSFAPEIDRSHGQLDDGRIDNDVPTASAGAIPKSRIRIGVVIEPAPTPVSPTAIATMNPTRNVISCPQDNLILSYTTITLKSIGDWMIGRIPAVGVLASRDREGALPPRR